MKLRILTCSAPRTFVPSGIHLVAAGSVAEMFGVLRSLVNAKHILTAHVLLGA